MKREGLLFLYKTSWGMKLIDRIGKKYQRTLKFLSYVSITIGYFLMALMLYLFGKIVYVYVTNVAFVKAVKIPPITPLIPYIDKIVPGFPPFYFIYWIIILAIIAVFHEFAHGIFMRRYNVKVKSTGFGFFPFFLPVFLAAFVEQDEKSMQKVSRFKQKAILSAGTFANILTAVATLIVMILFFNLAFASSGVVYDNYAYGIVGIGTISSINNITLENPNYSKILELTEENKLNRIETSEGEYILTREQVAYLENQESEYIYAYYDSPAINAGLENVITKINDKEIKNIEDLGEEIALYSPGEKITIETNRESYEILLGEKPGNEEDAWIGIVFEEQQRKGVIGKIFGWVGSFKDPHINYVAKFNGANFIHNLLWWLAIISFSVALVNMLPMGIFDGGRFFYLTVLGLTKSKKKAKKWFAASTSILLSLLILMMIFWVFGLIR